MSLNLNCNFYLHIHKIDGKKEEVVLKDKELKFIQLACTEKTYKEIADILFLSPKT